MEAPIIEILLMFAIGFVTGIGSAINKKLMFALGIFIPLVFVIAVMIKPEAMSDNLDVASYGFRAFLIVAGYWVGKSFYKSNGGQNVQ